MSQSNLHGLADAGVSIWSDQISRHMLESGELARRIEEDAVTGVTSNPTIFAGAISGSTDYDDQLNDLKSTGASTEEMVKSLMADDIRAGCDVLAPVHRHTGGTDGFVSIEVSPLLASDTEATVSEARDWVKQIDRPNLLVKVPATPEGVPAIRRLTGEGISINVTLIFSLARYDEVIDAYLTGLEDYRATGGDLSEIASVASFFVSRFDTEADKRLTASEVPGSNDLLGTTALANARVAYGTYLDRFASGRFRALADEGARSQRPLWASTSTKNPEYDDLLYVEGLVADNSVNTMPLDTIDAYQDHGDPSPTRFTKEDIIEAREQLDRLAGVGVDYDDIVLTLEKEGVDKFAASWAELRDKVDSF